MIRITSILLTVFLLFSTQAFAVDQGAKTEVSSGYIEHQRFTRLILTTKDGSPPARDSVAGKFNAAVNSVAEWLENEKAFVSYKGGKKSGTPQILINGKQIPLDPLFNSLQSAHNDLVAQTDLTSVASQSSPKLTALRKALVSIRKALSALRLVSSPTLKTAEAAINSVETSINTEINEPAVPAVNDDPTTIQAEIADLNAKVTGSTAKVAELEKQLAAAKAALVTAKTWTPTQEQSEALERLKNNQTAANHEVDVTLAKVQSSTRAIAELGFNEKTQNLFKDIAFAENYLSESNHNINKRKSMESRLSSYQRQLTETQLTDYHKYKPLYQSQQSATEALTQARLIQEKLNEQVQVEERTLLPQTYIAAAESSVSQLETNVTQEESALQTTTERRAALTALAKDSSAVQEYNALAKLRPLDELYSGNRYQALRRITALEAQVALEKYYGVKGVQQLPDDAKALFTGYTSANTRKFLGQLLTKENYMSLDKAWEEKVNSEVTSLQINPNGIVPDTDTTPTTNTNNPEQGTDTTSAPEPIISEPIISEPIISEPIIPPPD